MISVDELQKSMNDVAKEKVNPQEPPSNIPPVINVQNLIQMPKDTSTKVDTIVKIDIHEKKTTKEQATTIGQQGTNQIDLLVQGQDASQVTTREQGNFEESEKTPKLKEKTTIQALVTLPLSGTTSTQTL